MGNLMGALMDQVLAKQSGGVAYLRIEDTDKKREVAGAVEEIIDVLAYFGIDFDEGVLGDGRECGDYGPYRQSDRKAIYQAFARKLVVDGYAYPCFCTSKDLEEMRQVQESKKETPGYYGAYAKHRELTLDQVADSLKKSAFVLRLKSRGNLETRVDLLDGVRGKISMPENNQDLVILKSDGMPTYHFAHVVDDYLMGTTHVVRGDEWLSSYPLHHELFKALSLDMPEYLHISPIMKKEGTSKRKLSKRKDPEAALSYYKAKGYPGLAVRDYLLNLLNSSFEIWRDQNPGVSSDDYQLKLDQLSVSGSVFDLAKFKTTSRDMIASMTAEQVYDEGQAWAKVYNPKLLRILSDKAYSISILSIERGGAKPRKDIESWTDLEAYMGWFNDGIYEERAYKEIEGLTCQQMVDILTSYKEEVSYDLSSESWFEHIKSMAENLGYAKNMKVYKKTPDSYQGHMGQLMACLRMALAKQAHTPDLYQVVQTVGRDRVKERLEKMVVWLKERLD